MQSADPDTRPAQQLSSRDLVISADSPGTEEYLSMSTLNCAKYAARWTVVRGCSDSAWCHIHTELSAAESGQETVLLLMVGGGVIQQLSLGLTFIT